MKFFYIIYGAITIALCGFLLYSFIFGGEPFTIIHLSMLFLSVAFMHSRKRHFWYEYISLIVYDLFAGILTLFKLLEYVRV